MTYNSRVGEVTVRQFKVGETAYKRHFVYTDRWGDRTKFAKPDRTFYKVVTGDLRSSFGGQQTWVPGEWVVLDTEESKPIVACQWGLHVTEASKIGNWLRDTSYRLFEVEVAGPIIRHSDDKYIAAAVRLVREIPVTQELYATVTGRNSTGTRAKEESIRRINLKCSLMVLERAMKRPDFDTVTNDAEKAWARAAMEGASGMSRQGPAPEFWFLLRSLRSRMAIATRKVQLAEAMHQYNMVGKNLKPEEQRAAYEATVNEAVTEKKGIRTIVRVLRISEGGWDGRSYTGLFGWKVQDALDRERRIIEKALVEEYSNQHVPTLDELLARTVGGKQKRGV